MMKIALIQCPIVWENPIANRAYFEGKINTADIDTDLIVLPEMFTTGFTMNCETPSETMQGTTVLWLQSLSNKKKCAIMGSLIIEENSKRYNRLIFVSPNENVVYYDKRHLFSFAGEDKIYSKGDERKIISYNGWKICPLICYDLRFPVFSRNNEDYDILIYVANWPKSRINAWNCLLKARAIENLSYVIGVNRVGTDNNNNYYNGQSQAIDFLGNYLIEPTENEGTFYTQFSKEPLLNFRKQTNFLADIDAFLLT